MNEKQRGFKKIYYSCNFRTRQELICGLSNPVSRVPLFLLPLVNEDVVAIIPLWNECSDFTDQSSLMISMPILFF